MDSSYAADAAAGVMALMSMMMIFVAVMVAIVIVPLWRILSRMGFAGAWSLVILIPLGSLIGLYVVAFSDWPLERRVTTSADPARAPTIS